MKNRFALILVTLLLPAVILVIPSCDIDGDLAECPYNVKLEYWYNTGGSANRLTDYIGCVDGYVFDSEGILCAINRATGKDAIYGELNLAPGDYTIVSWGNRDTTSRIYPDARIGESRLRDMQLRLDNPYTAVRSTGVFHHVAEKLYYNYLEVNVSGRGVTREYARMSHAHCRLNLTVVWKYSPPENTDDFSFCLSGVPQRYAFPASGDFPGIEQERVSIRREAKMSIVRSLSGELVCYRLTNNDHPPFSVYRGEEPLLEDLDLWKFFTTMHIDLDNNQRQEFDLKVEIDGAGVYVSTLSSGDWEDGGEVDGVM
ncbi:MAG: FimB/Mfa2 family fimbrial subunit [Parabacteroides sp.]|nr:FimB/Mfa2 family fimbrial subunit [Parabacteroides sp.]